MNELSLWAKVNILFSLMVMMILFWATALFINRNRLKSEFGSLIIEVKENLQMTHIVLAVLWFVVGVISMIEVLAAKKSPFESSGLVFLIGSLIFILRGLSKIQIRESGMISGDSYWTWNDVEKCSWINGSNKIEFKLHNRIIKKRSVTLHEDDIPKVKEALSNVINVQ